MRKSPIHKTLDQWLQLLKWWRQASSAKPETVLPSCTMFWYNKKLTPTSDPRLSSLCVRYRRPALPLSTCPSGYVGNPSSLPSPEHLMKHRVCTTPEFTTAKPIDISWYYSDYTIQWFKGNPNDVTSLSFTASFTELQLLYSFTHAN